MKIKVLQGVNLQSPVTQIIIELDAKPRTDVIDEVKSFHPIFLNSYKAERNTLIIESKLPHLWKEIAPALNSYAKADWNHEKTRLYILENVIKKQVLSMSTIPILYEAMKQNYEIVQYYMEEGLQEKPGEAMNRHYCLGCGKGSQINVSASCTKDSHLAQKTQKDKWTTNIVMDRLKIPIAEWELINSREEIALLFKKYSKPFVIKPTGLTGGSGVTTGINTLEQAYIAYDMAQKAIESKNRPDWQQKIMIQQQVEGEDYRVLVINGKARIATKRIPAFVIGDGKSTLKQLIEKTNTDPRRDILNPTHVLKPIVFDEMLDLYLKEKKLTYEYVPKKGEKVRVRKPASMSQGGVTEDFTEKIHPQIKILAETIAESIHAYTLGVDVICKEINKPLNKTNGTIIEVNTMPEMYLNIFPTYGKEHLETVSEYIKGLLKDNKTERIVVIDSETSMDKILAKAGIKKDDYFGIYRNNCIFINGYEINQDIDTWRAIEALKLNASLDKILFVYDSIEDVRESGTGFDQIDKLLIEKNSKDMRIFESYNKKGYIKKIITL